MLENDENLDEDSISNNKSNSKQPLKEMTKDVINMLSQERDRDEIVIKSGSKSKNNNNVNVKGVRKIDFNNKQNALSEKTNDENLNTSEVNKGFYTSKSQIDVSLNKKSKFTSDEIIQNLAENHEINTNNKKDTQSKKPKSKDELQNILNTSNNESILSMKLDEDALNIKIINGIKSNNENCLTICSQNNDSFKLLYSSGTNIISTDVSNFQMNF